MKRQDAINTLADIRDYLREILDNGEIPQTLCDEFNKLAAHLTGDNDEGWCAPTMANSRPKVKTYAIRDNKGREIRVTIPED